MSFDKTIRDARRAKNISQRAAADALHISQSTLSRYEKGNGTPDDDLKQAMISYYGITDSAIAEEPEEKQMIKEQTDCQNSNPYTDAIFTLIEKYKHQLWIVTVLILIFLSLVPTGMNPVFDILATYIAIKQKFHPIIIVMITGWTLFITLGILEIYGIHIFPTRVSVTPLD